MAHFEITDAQSEALDVLVPLGFAITHIYGDGIIRVRERNTGVAIFVRRDGSLKKQLIPTFDSDGNRVANG